MSRFGKRKNEASNEDLVCSPRKQMRSKGEIIPTRKVNVGKDVASSSEESDSEVAEDLFSKLRNKRHESDMKETEEDDSDVESSGDDDDDDDDNDPDDHDDNDEEVVEKGNNSTEVRNYNKIDTNTESAKVILTKGNNIILENKKDKVNMSDSSDENSDPSPSEDSSDGQENVNENNTINSATSRLKVTSVKQVQQPGKKRKNVIQSSDDSSSDDSSINDEDGNFKHVEDEMVVNTNSGIRKSSNKENLKRVGTDSDESSDESDDDRDVDEIMKDESRSNSKVTQSHIKHQSVKEVKQDVQTETNRSLQGSDSSDSEDDNNSDDNDSYDNDDSDDNDSDDNDDANMKDEDDKVAESEESEDEFASVKKELANMPLEDLMKIKEKLGLKMFNRIMHGDKFEEKKQKVFKRENKNRPMEISAKKRVPVMRNAMVPKEKVRRDPRFDDLSGEFQDKHFMRNYAFLDDVKQREKLLVQKKLKKTKDVEKKKELSKLLNRMNQQEQLEQKKRHRMEMEKQWKEKEKQLVKEGKTPYFLKKSDKKKLELAEKFKELQKSGKVDNYMSKKMKKNAQKEKRKLPGRHQKLM